VTGAVRGIGARSMAVLAAALGMSTNQGVPLGAVKRSPLSAGRTTPSRMNQDEPLLRRAWVMLGANLGDVHDGEQKPVQAVGDNRVYLACGVNGGVTLRRAIPKTRGKKARARDKTERRMARRTLEQQGVD